MCCVRIGTCWGRKKNSSHAHKTGCRYILGFFFKISDEHPSFLNGVPQGYDSCFKGISSSLQGFVLGRLRIASTNITLVHQAQWNVSVFLVTCLKTNVAALSKK